MPNLSALPERLPGCLPGCRELRSIHLRTLNKERAEILAQYWLREGRVLSPPQVGTAQVPPARLPAHPPACLWGRAALNRPAGTFTHTLVVAAAHLTASQTSCVPASLQVSEEERFVLPPHIEGESEGE